MNVLGLLIARAGSKGLPGKNFENLGGRPMFEWAAIAAKEAQGITHLALSTDDEKIIELCQRRRLAIDIPFVRPPELAQDDTLAVDVLRHALDFYDEQGREFDYICLLQPTSPFVKSEDIDRAIDLARHRKADTVIAVFENESCHPSLMYELHSDFSATPYSKETQGLPRQQQNKNYVRTGLFYLISRETLHAGRIYGDQIYAVVVPEERSVCIDTPFDLNLAKFLMEQTSDNSSSNTE